MDRLLMGLLGALVAFAAGLPALGDRDFWPPDEARYGEIVQARLNGVTSVWAPHSNGVLYPDKPPGYFLIIEGFARALGRFDEGVSRLPAVLGGAMCAAAVGYLSTGAFGAIGALGGILLMASTVAFSWQLRYTQMDMLVAGLVALMLTAAYRSGESGSSGWSYVAWLFFGIGMFVKGPLAAVGLVVWVAWCSFTGKHAAFWNRGSAFGAVTVVACGLWWFYLARESLRELGPDVPSQYFGTMFGTHVLERVTGGVAHDKPWYAYAYILPAMLLPATPLLLVAWSRSWIRALSPQARQLLLFALLWILLPLVLLSVSAGKRSIYLLPLFPAIGVLFAAIVAQAKLRCPSGIKVWVAAIGLLSSVAGIMVLVLTTWPTFGVDVLTSSLAVIRRLDENQVHDVLAGAHGRCLTFGGVVLLCGLVVLALSLKGRVITSVISAAAVTLVGMVLFNALLAPLGDPFISRRPIAEQARLLLAERGSDGPVYYFSHRDEAVPFYLQRVVREIGNRDRSLSIAPATENAGASSEDPKWELLQALEEPGSLAFATTKDLSEHNIELQRDVHELARGRVGSKTIVLIERMKP